MTLTLLAWNIRQGGGRRAQDLVQAIVGLNADVVVISEFRPMGKNRLLQLLREAGYVHPATEPPQVDGHTNVLVVSRREPDEIASPLTYRWKDGHDSHRFSHVRVAGWDILGCYIPGADRRDDSARKRAYWRFLLDEVHASMSAMPAVVIGDLNTGLHERDENGSTLVCADDMAQLEGRGWRDAWNDAHPTERPPGSWWSPKYRNPFRLDHALLSPEGPAALSVEYVTGAEFPCRDQVGPRLSDHSPLLINLPEVRRGLS